MDDGSWVTSLGPVAGSLIGVNPCPVRELATVVIMTGDIRISIGMS
jgi:hypothetical protein